MPESHEIARILDLIKNAEYMIALTGAGISAESGIPTFRGADGLWKKFRAEELATPWAFQKNPKLVWEWYKWRMGIIAKAKPNPAHYCLAKLEDLGLLKYLITQNVDGLHTKAGSKKIVEIHGNIWRAKCTKCDYKMTFNKPPDSVPVSCPECNELMRPDVVWFGEPLPRDAIALMFELARKADLILVIGTSLLVEPAASIPFIVLEHNGKAIEINLTETKLTPYATVSIQAPAGKTLKKVCDLLSK